jgi:hypothetical protein
MLWLIIPSGLFFIYILLFSIFFVGLSFFPPTSPPDKKKDFTSKLKMAKTKITTRKPIKSSSSSRLPPAEAAALRVNNKQEEQEEEDTPSSSPPSSPAADATTQWLQRKYDWTAKDASYKLMPDGFTPPADDLDSYVTLASFSDQLLQEMAAENKQAQYNQADIVLQETHWSFVIYPGEMVVSNLYDGSVEVTLKGTNWSYAFHDNKTYIKKMVDDDTDSDATDS